MGVLDVVEFDYLNGLIETTATKLGNQYRGFVERDDIAQHLWEWVLRKQTKIAQWQTENDPRGFQKVLGAALFTEARGFARRAKADVLGYSLEDEFLYSKAQLESLLPAVFDREQWLEPPQGDPGGGRTSRPAGEGGNWVATLADVARAVGALDAGQQDLLRMIHVDGRSMLSLERELTLSRRGLEHRVDACYRVLIRVLNEPKPANRVRDVVGSRRVLSNRQAQSVTRNYER